jgi:2-polyprenyl-6-methoxyphenol hydroxylase-like FAD-dependent oxidoreductase
MGRSAMDGDEAVGGHAVVIGGSMTGLFAARVLSDHFERVTIVERDQLPESPEFRHGVPQSRHIHVLLKRGLEVMEELFPGLEAELVTEGAVPVAGADFLWLTAAGWASRFPGVRLQSLSMSRELIEWSVRKRVLHLPNVSLPGRRDATGLAPSADGSRVTGLLVKERGTGATSLVEADLVVDASGRGSKAPQWLEALGYPRPQETVINSHVGYASRYYRRPSRQSDWKVLMIHPRPPSMPRSGMIFPIEGNRWVVSLAGFGDFPPNDDAGFLEFTRRLRSPFLHEALGDAEPISPIHGYRATANQRRHYESLARQPDGFVVVGDAACAFNPVYGQGMTVAALTALELRRCLREGAQRFPARLQRAVARINEGPWVIATGGDVRYPTTEGAEPSVADRFMQRYLDRVVKTATRDEFVFTAFVRVIHMLDSPRALLRPGVVWRALKGAGPPPTEPPRMGDLTPLQTGEALGAPSDHRG